MKDSNKPPSGAASAAKPAPPDAGTIAWARRTLQNEDYLPWRDAKKAREILGLPPASLTDEEQRAYAALINQKPATQGVSP